MKFFILLSLLICSYSVDGKNFYLNTSQKMDWYSALIACTRQGRQLATVMNQQENEQIKTLIRNAYLTHEYFWLSATDLAGESNFVWAPTGEQLKYFDFDPAPNNAGGNEHCVHIWMSVGYGNKHSWNDLHCTAHHYFVCEDKVIENYENVVTINL